ncbi:MAG: HD domain-containing protein [Candidatus Yanofskybacteria bacterium]|nr:HD domain-containing protein [Candidatus Yanofskybacteria bacterium]
MGIFGHILQRSLAHIRRFSSTPQHFPESVAEHSFFTAYIALILCDLTQARGETVDKEKVLAMALVHDKEEAFSGDILTPFKHYSPEITETIRRVNKEVIPQEFEGLPDTLKERYISLWVEEGEGKSIEAQMVKTADRLSLIAKCAEEVRVGNKFFQGIYEKQLSLLKNQEFSWWKKIQEQVLAQETRD